jgi:MoaA/NifB/PqqE/SkfB family radical SAM enzyme
MDEFEESLDFLERSAVGYVSLLGGEPTIHPQFAEMMDRAIARRFRVLVLSGGLIPERVMKKLEAASKDELSVMMNIAPPGGEFSRREQEKQKEVMLRLGSKVVLGLNIDSPGVALEFLLDWIDEYQLERAVRLGLAHPIVGGANAYLDPGDYPAVGRRVANFAFQAREACVQIEFDCGWVPCMFPEGVLQELGIPPQQVGMRCNPILDVLPGRQVISCYPLAEIAREPLPSEHDGSWLADRFTERLSSYRPMMLYRKCATCAWRERGECTGGCIAKAMRRMQSPVQIERTQSAPVQIGRRVA